MAVRGVAKSLEILNPNSSVVSWIGPPDAAFARAAKYSFLFMRPDGRQLAKIGELLAASRIRPVIDRVFPFAQAKAGLAYLERGRAKGKVVVQMK